MNILQDKIIEGINYYLTDPSRRCQDDVGGCYYSGISAKNYKSEGCFIGRFLSPEDRLKADEGLRYLDTTVACLLEAAEELGVTVPKWMIDAPISLLLGLQEWHDSSIYWEDNQEDNHLTETGVLFLKETLDMHSDVINPTEILKATNLI